MSPRRDPHDFRSKYIRVTKHGRFQVRIPFDGSGRCRINLGSYQEFAAARDALRRFIRHGERPAHVMPPWVRRQWRHPGRFIMQVRVPGLVQVMGGFLTAESAHLAAVALLIVRLKGKARRYFPGGSMPDASMTQGECVAWRQWTGLDYSQTDVQRRLRKWVRFWKR